MNTRSRRETITFQHPFRIKDTIASRLGVLTRSSPMRQPPALNLYAAVLAPADTNHRDLVAPVFADFARLSNDG